MPTRGLGNARAQVYEEKKCVETFHTASADCCWIDPTFLAEISYQLFCKVTN